MATVRVSGHLALKFVPLLRPTTDEHCTAMISFLKQMTHVFLSVCGFPENFNYEMSKECLDGVADIVKISPQWLIFLAKASFDCTVRIPDYLADVAAGGDGLMLLPDTIDTSRGFFQASGPIHLADDYMSFIPKKYEMTHITCNSKTNRATIIGYNDMDAIFNYLMSATFDDPFLMTCSAVGDYLTEKQRVALDAHLAKCKASRDELIVRVSKMQVDVPVSMFEFVSDEFVNHMSDTIAQALLRRKSYRLFVKYIERNIGAKGPTWAHYILMDEVLPEWCITDGSAHLLFARVENVYGAIALDVTDGAFDAPIERMRHQKDRSVICVDDRRYIIGNINVKLLSEHLRQPKTRDRVRHILNALNIELFPAVVYKQLVDLRNEANSSVE